MDITDIPVEGYERVARCTDEASGLHALIAVHDTTLGPSLGASLRSLPCPLGKRWGSKRALTTS